MSLEPELIEAGKVNCTYRIVRRDGTLRWIQDSTQRVERDGQKYYQCALLDIHDFVDDLNKAKKEAEESSAAKTTFLFNASHDIRTPMNAISGFAHIIEHNADNPEVVKDAVGKIMKSGKTLMTLLNDILELSRIERGKDELNLEEVYLHEHGKSLIEMFAADMEAKGITFKVESSITHTHVLCDPIKLTRIGMNFLSNAKKFTPKGGTVIFGIEEISSDENTATYRFYSKDTGIGMSKDFQQRAFGQFERERTATESGVTGSGLGLSITKRIVDLMGGKVEIKSELGKGTEIYATLTFELVDEVVAEERMEAAKTVDMLLKNNSPYYDLILMDIQMPVMDGYKATEEIRNIADKDISSVPIIAMTANAFEEDKKSVINVNFRRHKGLYIGAGILLAVAVGIASIFCIIKSTLKQWPGAESKSNLYVNYQGEEYTYKDEIINIICVGIDRFESLEKVAGSAKGGLADAIYLVSVNTKTRDWGITVIPRDTMTDIIRTDMEGNEIGTQKLQLAYQYVTGKTPKQSGEFMKRAVSSLLHGVPIHHFCTLNFRAIPIINDMVGGVDVKVIEDLTWGVPEFVLGETVHLKGKKARHYVRMRNTEIPGSNLLRIERQKQYIAAFFEKAKKEAGENKSLLMDMYSSLKNNLCTDLSKKEIIYLTALLKELSFDEAKMHQIDGNQVKGEVFEEFYHDDDALKKFLAESFFEKSTEGFTSDSVICDWDIISENEEVMQPTAVPTEMPVETAEPYPNDINFNKLKKANPDIYGWIRIPGTNIDYPLLSNKKDGYYLDYLYTGQKGTAGAIFTDKYNAKDMTDPVTVVYGHNMNRSGTMFSELHKYEKRKFLRKYPYVYVYLPNETLIYQIFLAAAADDRYILSAYDFSEAEGFEKYLTDLNAGEMKVTDNNVSVKYGEPVIVLSTCFSGYPRKRWLVNAKLIQREST